MKPHRKAEPDGTKVSFWTQWKTVEGFTAYAKTQQFRDTPESRRTKTTDQARVESME